MHTEVWDVCTIFFILKFIYSEKATEFCEIFSLLLSYVVPVKSKGKISQNFVAVSEYMIFKVLPGLWTFSPIFISCTSTVMLKGDGHHGLSRVDP